MCNILRGWDKGGMFDKEVIRGGSKEGERKTCTCLGGGSSTSPEAVGRKTEGGVETKIATEMGSETMSIGAEDAPMGCKATSCS